MTGFRMIASSSSLIRRFLFAVIEQVQPHLTLVSNRADPALIDAIKATRKRNGTRFQDAEWTLLIG